MSLVRISGTPQHTFSPHVLAQKDGWPVSLSPSQAKIQVQSSWGGKGAGEEEGGGDRGPEMTEWK